MNTIKLTNQELTNLHMALLTADQVARTRVYNAKGNQAKQEMAEANFQNVQALLSKALQALDTLNAARI